MAQTPSTTNYAEIQENELQVLRSIYMEDFEEDKTKAGAWNVGLIQVTGLASKSCLFASEYQSNLLVECIYTVS